MNKETKEIKAMTLDLAKTLSYLTELEKTNNQVYATKEGMALLEGVVIAGNGKVKVVSSDIYKVLDTENTKLIKDLEDMRDRKNKAIMRIAELKEDKKGFWFNLFN